MRNHIISLFYYLLATVFFLGCGEEKELTGIGLHSDKSKVESDDAVAADTESHPEIKVESTSDRNDKKAEDNAINTLETIATESTVLPIGTVYSFPEEIRTEEDKNSLTRCLENFPGHPFGKDVKNVRRIVATIAIGSISTPLEDRMVTAEPQLVLINAAAAFNSEVIYNLLNPNAYYCIDGNFNVDSNLTVNLSCAARITDSKFTLAVDSNVNNSTPAGIGIHIDSQVVVNNIDNGEGKYKCLRK